MVKKLILFGQTGMLGGYIYKYFSDKGFPICAVNGFRVSLATMGSIEQVLVDIGLDEQTCVINCIGKIPQRNSGSSDTDYYVVNSIFPHVLWEICKARGAKMIQPATDCVFTGSTGGYVESDVADETSAYGKSKSMGEPLESTVIRCSIIGREVRNKTSLIEFLFKSVGGSVKGWNNHMWNGVTCLQYCKIVEQIIEKNMFWKGVRHLLSPRPVSKYELLVMVKEAYGLNVEIFSVSAPIAGDKTLQTECEENSLLTIPDLAEQLKDLKSYTI
jgi:dTDP-4-dehydrorhamnose reductase